MILFDESKRILKLDTESASYVIGIFDQGHILNLYYGPYLPDHHLWSLARISENNSFNPADPVIPNETFSPDVAPMEYSGNGNGDMRIAALAIRNAQGNSVTDMRYTGHKIYAGKPSLSPLPHTYLNDENEADTLELYVQDAVTGAQAVLYYTAFRKLNVITRSVKVINGGDTALDIEKAFSLCLSLPTMDYDLLTLYGRHNKERSREQRRLAHGVQGVASRRGSSSHHQNPFGALVRHGADETQGEVYGFNLIYSGNFEFTAECDHAGSTRVVMGINPTDFCWHLEPSESFQTPEAVMVYTDKGIGEMSRIFHRLYRQHLIRGKYKNEKRPLLINSWEAAYFDFNTDKLAAFAANAKELGIEMLVMDDGWFGKRNDDTNSLGDWYVNEEKLPGGLSVLIDKVNAQGMKFGIWYEPEMISPDSDLFRAHPDWLVHVAGRTPSIGRHQYVLDMSREDVRENIWNQMYAVLSRHKIDYLKWDFNRNLSEAGSALLPPERQKEFFHRFVLGTYDLMDRLTRTFPDILLENCSGGGGRFDPGMLYYSPQIWASDNTDPIERLTIQFGTSLCYPASTMGAHVSDCERTGYDTKGNVALWGTFGYELDPTKLAVEEKALIKQQVQEYHRQYDLIRDGDLYRLIDPYEDPYKCAWSFVAEDKSQVLVTAVVMRENFGARFRLRLAGLNPLKRYQNQADGEIYSGALLMHAGIDLTDVIQHDGESIQLFFTEVSI